MEWLNHDLIKDMEKGRGLGGQEGTPTTGEIRGTHVCVSGPVLLIPERKSRAAAGAVSLWWRQMCRKVSQPDETSHRHLLPPGVGSP